MEGAPFASGLSMGPGRVSCPVGKPPDLRVDSCALDKGRLNMPLKLPALIPLLIALFSSPARAALSPLRDPGVDARAYIESRLASSTRPQGRDGSAPLTVLQAGVRRGGLDPSRIPEVSREELALRFQEIRDARPLKDGENRDRRLTWLYPDDGCYARAEIAVHLLESSRRAVPLKVFAFGNLSVKTENHPHGWISWWYHVAPVLRVEGIAYVLDPAIEPRRPLSVDEWIARMGDGPIGVSYCASHAYDPDSPCATSETSQKNRAVRDVSPFLGSEWNRLLEMGRDPAAELGEHPPWIRPEETPTP